MRRTKSIGIYGGCAAFLYVLAGGLMVLNFGERKWAAVLAAVLLAAAAVWGIRHLLWFPKSAVLCPELKERLPCRLCENGLELYILDAQKEKKGYGIQTMLFLPLFGGKGAGAGLVVRKEFLAQSDPLFFEMTAVREIGMKRLGITQKNLCQLVGSLSGAAALLFLYLYNRRADILFVPAWLLDIIAPIALTLVLFGLLLFWNWMVSKRDRQLEQFMAESYDREQLQDYWKKSEPGEAGKEKNSPASGIRRNGWKS